MLCTHRIHRPAIVCALACALLASAIIGPAATATASASAGNARAAAAQARYYASYGTPASDAAAAQGRYYSSYGHIEAMANAVAEGARQAGAHVDIKRVPELVPEEIARKSHYKLDQEAPIAKVNDLAAYDAIVIGAGTRFGRLWSQMANLLDQAGGLWARGALHGKVGGVFTSTATQHGGQ